jgi:hypothetical protein
MEESHEDERTCAVPYLCPVINLCAVPYLCASAWKNHIGMGEPHAHMGSQRSHLPLHRSFFCFRYVLCFIADSVLFRRSGCTPSSANRGLDSVGISMRTSWAWENRMGMREPHPHMGESLESLSASSLSILLQVRRLLHC